MTVTGAEHQDAVESSDADSSPQGISTLEEGAKHPPRSQGDVDLSPNGDGLLRKLVVKQGSGYDVPTLGCSVTVHYTGTLLDGSKFDSSKDRDQPFTFPLGKGHVIKAWDLSVATMKKGEVSIVTCAPEFGYGENGSPPKIPPNSWLNFEIEVISWQGEDISPRKNNGILRYTIIPGTGHDYPTEGALLNVEMEGKLHGVEDAKPFEKRTVSFYLGEGCEYDILEGVEKALEKFKMGEKSRLVISSEYAFRGYGNKELGVPPGVPVEYIVTLTSFEKLNVDSYDYDYVMKQGRIFKEKGTEYFKAEKYVLAVKMYKNAVAYFSNNDLEAEESPVERKNLLLASHLNLSMSYLKCIPVDAISARNSAVNALKMEPNNVKGLFRKGKALEVMGEYNEAIQEFEKVIEIEHDNKAAANQILICKTEIKKQAERERRLYANMFEKFADKDREKELMTAQNQPDVMCEALGEWGSGAGEWADTDRDRAPTDFEKENPNILMLDKDGQFLDM